MTTHLMCDLETWGTRPGAIVLSAALVRFSDEANTTVNLNVHEQEALGLEKDDSTLAWWSAPERADALAVTLANSVPIVPALQHLTAWMQWAAPDGDFLLWCHGATFDAPILGEVYRRVGIRCPWTEQFWRVQCTRTLYNLAGIDKRDYDVPPPHVALNDAIAQTRAANAALRVLAGVRGVAA